MVLHEVSAEAQGRADGVCEARARKWYISADPESIPVCGVNLVSVLLAEISDWKEKSHYQIGPAQHVSPKHTPLFSFFFFLFFFFFFVTEWSQSSANLRGDFGLSAVRDFFHYTLEYYIRLYLGFFFVHAGPNPNQVFKFFAKLLIFLFYPKAL